RAHGGELSDASNLPELALQRRGDRGRHRLRAGPLQRGAHLNGGKVDLRQRRYRQQRKRDKADKTDPRHHERRGDRAPDERFGNIHDEPSRFATSGRGGSSTVTREPGRSLYWPLTTTRSPGESPDVTIVWSSVVGPTLTGRASATPSGLTTQVKIP